MMLHWHEGLMFSLAEELNTQVRFLVVERLFSKFISTAAPKIWMQFNSFWGYFGHVIIKCSYALHLLSIDINIISPFCLNLDDYSLCGCSEIF